MRVRVPSDISVLGFDNIPQSAAFYPALTTFAQPVEALAQESLRLLINRINGSTTPPTCIMLDAQLVERESCTAPSSVPTPSERP